MNYLLDVLGSTVIAGIVLMMLLNINIFQTNTRIESSSELQMQQNAKTLASIINYDLRKIGYEYAGNAFIEADSERVSYYSDIDRNGSTDIVTYFTGSPSEVPGTTNPNDIILYRVINNTDTIAGPSLGLTKAKFSYLDQSWNETTIFTDITYVKAELWIESIEHVDGEYLFTYWEMTINPRNL